jgi:hypothetical protein
VQLAHACRQIPFRGFDEEMVIEGHEAVGVAEPIEIGDSPAKDIQKHALIGIIEAYRAVGVSSGITWEMASEYSIRRGLAMMWLYTWQIQSS